MRGYYGSRRYVQFTLIVRALFSFASAALRQKLNSSREKGDAGIIRVYTSLSASFQPNSVEGLCATGSGDGRSSENETRRACLRRRSHVEGASRSNYHWRFDRNAVVASRNSAPAGVGVPVRRRSALISRLRKYLKTLDRPRAGARATRREDARLNAIRNYIP